jgi:hypothetical protein
MLWSSGAKPEVGLVRRHGQSKKRWWAMGLAGTAEGCQKKTLPGQHHQPCLVHAGLPGGGRTVSPVAGGRADEVRVSKCQPE